MDNENEFIKLLEIYLKRDIDKEEIPYVNRLNQDIFYKKIKKIVEYDLEQFIYLVKKFYFNFVKQYIHESINEIEKRIKKYFINEYRIDKEFNKFKNKIEFQNIIATYYLPLLGSLTKKKENDMITIIDIDPILSNNKLIVDDNIKNLIINYENQIKIKLVEKDEPKDDDINDDIINKLIDLLKNVIKNVLIKQNNISLCYGSYTPYNLDNNIVYNDIDLYHNNSFQFLVCLISVIYFTTGIETNMFSIPFISGHNSIRYKNIELIDCIYLDKNTMNSIDKSFINNINFVNPGLQMLNNFRMSLETFRLNKIHKEKENTIKKYSTLLSYFIQNSDFNYDRFMEVMNSKIDLIDYEYEGNCLIIHLDKILNIDGINKLFVIFGDPKNFIDFVKDKNGLFSKRYYAFLDELFFEYYPIQKSSSEEVKYNFSTLLVDEDEFTNEDYNDYNISKTQELFNKYSDKRILFLTNLSTSIYKKENSISLRNIQSIIATYTLYLFLHKQYNIGFELYYYLLKILELKHENINTYQKIRRYKRKGNHIEINIVKNIFKTKKNFKNTEKDYLTYYEMKEFLSEFY